MDYAVVGTAFDYSKCLSESAIIKFKDVICPLFFNAMWQHSAEQIPNLFSNRGQLSH